MYIYIYIFFQKKYSVEHSLTLHHSVTPHHSLHPTLSLHTTRHGTSSPTTAPCPTTTEPRLEQRQPPPKTLFFFLWLTGTKCKSTFVGPCPTRFRTLLFLWLFFRGLLVLNVSQLFAGLRPTRFRTLLGKPRIIRSLYATYRSRARFPAALLLLYCRLTAALLLLYCRFFFLWQGVEDTYTDPQIHTGSGKGFGRGNLGQAGITAFLTRHKCNAICEHLGLPLLGCKSVLPCCCVAAALLVLYWCFTGALLVLYWFFTAALPADFLCWLAAAALLVLYCCITAGWLAAAVPAASLPLTAVAAANCR
jgi:hypothetical protein